jgi:hypothetical protein
MIILEIIFWILLLDSLVALGITWCGKSGFWSKINYWDKFECLKKYMPLSKGWTGWYFILVLFIGYILYFIK